MIIRPRSNLLVSSKTPGDHDVVSPDEGVCVEFSVLGPLGAMVDGAQVPLGGRRQRIVLGLLLTSPNRSVCVDGLVDAVWPDRPPATARNQVKNAVWQLRGAFASAGEPDRVQAGPGGYAIRLVDAELDQLRFEGLARRAGAAADDEATDLYRQALAVWAGPIAYADLADVPCLERAAHRLTELRLTAVERLMTIELRRGRHRLIVDELVTHAQANPTREKLAELAMRALHRCDRQADALAVYAAVRRRLVDEFGIEPGQGLRHAHAEILAGEASKGQSTALAPTPPARAMPRPGQLPAVAGTFVGRSGELAALADLLDGEADRSSLVVVTGPPGVGKTALAVEAAHRAATVQFTDGQLFVNLHGFDEQAPVRPLQVLTGFLGALGLPREQVPGTLDEASALFRSMLAGRRMLIVLDNARDAECVRPLLPGAAGCAVLVTSRDRFAGLVAREGADLLPLQPLAKVEANDLLRRVVGDGRIDAEPEATAELVRLCGQLPLALRIAAANLVGDQQQTISEQVRCLHNEGLAGLAAGDDREAAVQLAFSRSYDVLLPSRQKLFRLLGLMPGREFTAHSAAALIGGDVAETGTDLRGLASAHMVVSSGPGRFTFHDLLRRFARQLAHAAEPQTSRDAALQRLFDWYVQTTYAAGTLVNPRGLRLARPEGRQWPEPFDDTAEAWTWLERETPNLAAVVEHAAEHGPLQAVWQIVVAIPTRCWHAGNISARLQMCEPAAEAASREGNLMAEVAVRRAQGLACGYLGNAESAIGHLRDALDVARRAGWDRGEAMILSDLGVRHQLTGDHDRSVEYLEAALAATDRAHDLDARSTVLVNLGFVSIRSGDLSAARKYQSEALALGRKAGDVISLGTRLLNLAYVEHLSGDLSAAEGLLLEALALQQTTKDSYAEAAARVGLAQLYCDWRRPACAMTHAKAAMEGAAGGPQPKLITEGRLVLGEACLVAGAHDQAVQHLTVAAASALEHSDPMSRAMALVCLSHALRLTDRLGDAGRTATEAATIAVQGGFRLHEGEAATALSAVHLARGQVDAALRQARRGMSIHSRTGYRLGLARAHGRLAAALFRSGETDTARRHRDAEREITAAVIGARQPDKQHPLRIVRPPHLSQVS